MGTAGGRRGLEGVERLYNNLVELHVAVNFRKLGNNHKGKALWMLRVAEAQGEAYNDRSSERQIESEIMVRRALWEAHVQSPTAALEVGVR